jgi:hypothetical protein
MKTFSGRASGAPWGAGSGRAGRRVVLAHLEEQRLHPGARQGVHVGQHEAPGDALLAARRVHHDGQHLGLVGGPARQDEAEQPARVARVHAGVAEAGLGADEALEVEGVPGVGEAGGVQAGAVVGPVAVEHGHVAGPGPSEHGARHPAAGGFGSAAAKSPLGRGGAASGALR